MKLFRNLFPFTLFVLTAAISIGQKKAALPANDPLKVLAIADIQSRYDEYKITAMQIWNFAEVGYKEVKSSGLLQKTLSDNGFEVKAGVAELKANAERKVGLLLDQLDAELARLEKVDAKPWLLGAHYSAVDAYTLMLCRWTRNFASMPARERPHLGPYLQRALARPAVVRVFEAEGLGRPWV